MQQNQNRLRKIIQDGGVALGTVFYAFSPALVEVAGLAGLSWCRIDNEHAWRQDFHTENLLRAASNVGMTALLRIDKGHSSLVRKGLEAGAGGIIVPHIQSPEEAREIVRAAKFPPLGDRGYGSLCFSGGWGLRGGQDWMTWSNRETLVIPMIEDVDAVENVDAIVSVEGVDGVLFGGSDYSVSNGLAPQPDHPIVVEGLKRTIEAAEKVDKFVLCTAGHPWHDDARRLIDLGVKGIEVGHDVSILGKVWSDAVKQLSPG